MSTDLPLITPDWPAPARVRAVCTTRAGGVSEVPWQSLNLAMHVGDDPSRVDVNRRRLAGHLNLEPEAFGWLDQVHGTDVVELPVAPRVPSADAAMTVHSRQVCAILTADCLPVLLCDRAGNQVAAAHAGWRGLCQGVLENVIGQFRSSPAELLAWLGPAIGPERFEVGPEVRESFLASNPLAEKAFHKQGARPGHYMADLYQLARIRLSALGVTSVFGEPVCTVSDPSRFYSYRRDGQTGRMASLIWLTP
ncbi:peptidoglycan editing factor PgeF [Marinobacter sp. F4216]|uniref:peptidoglycan editing factor PgeF n=1 Tax=Marinobacter sp. F4216 TaxID=2874281 RepID=UPI001CBCD6D3|nr:peptidoglycan editing factor PgeF [Marinobacter sp. F4216]MBZ2170093.1 peptidoglycan editing factor PgeF [Marinobacter sp. F4216]